MQRQRIIFFYISQLFEKVVNIHNVLYNCSIDISRWPKYINTSKTSVELENIDSRQVLSQQTSSTFSLLSSTDDPPFVLDQKCDTEVEYVEMSFPKVISTHKYCYICGT